MSSSGLEYLGVINCNKFNRFITKKFDCSFTCLCFIYPINYCNLPEKWFIKSVRITKSFLIVIRFWRWQFSYRTCLIRAILVPENEVFSTNFDICLPYLRFLASNLSDLNFLLIRHHSTNYHRKIFNY